MSLAELSERVKEDFGSPLQGTDTTAPPEECTKRETQLAATSHINPMQDAPPRPGRTICADTKVPSKTLKSAQDDKQGLSKASLVSSMRLPSVSAFKPVKTTLKRIAQLQSKVYEGAKKYFREAGSVSVLSQRWIKSAIELPPCKRIESRFLVSEIKLSAKRLIPEFNTSHPKEESEEGRDAFKCGYCEESFATGQALGGHMSRKHTGKSLKYNHKKDVRRQREVERTRLYMAKKKYFQELGYDYDAMIQTPDGKLRAKEYMNRSRIKKIKAMLGEGEIIA
eukprot:TRINITY_DN1197_c0_g2_i2.p1 TRINITY_DN1197_c0_g2~~TRINITY_DN1197_c0_g2_i2.p1  ORF type:complete len:281 (+),score=73.73 TRINITY_DN1197_c0_g2_i2:156-998(+)